MSELTLKILDYFKTKIDTFQQIKKRGSFLFTCPNINNHKYKPKEPTATFINGSDKIGCLICGWKGSIYDSVRLLEDHKKTWTDAQITEYFMDDFDLDLYKELEQYVTYKWSLVPIAKNSNAGIEPKQFEITHYEKVTWIKWLNNGLNIGLRTGDVSNVTVIDDDIGKCVSLTQEQTKTREEFIESIKKLDTLVQNTPHGTHYFIKYNKDIHQTVNIAGLHIDIRNDAGIIVVQPSKRDALGYTFKNLGAEIKVLPEEIVSKLLELMKVDKGRNVTKEVEVPKITDVDGIKKIKEGEGRNSFLLSLGGILINKFTGDDTNYILNLVSKNFFNPPLPDFEVKAMLKSLDKYKVSEEATHEKAIYDYMKLLQSDVNAKDIMDSLRMGRALVDKYLSKFVKEGKAIRLSRGRYKFREKIEWSDACPEQLNTFPYKIPYFSEIANFCHGDIVLLGARPKQGKTTTAMNIIKQFSVQGLKPHYIYSESGSRHFKLAKGLGLVENNITKFFSSYHSTPLSVEIERDTITILDWLLVSEKENSVEKNTPILIRKNNITEIIPINDLDAYYDYKKTYVWTLEGWTRLLKVIKHKVNKKMYRIITKESIIECTEDHSLMINGKEIKPSSLTLGDKIELVDFPYEHKLDINPEWAWLHGFVSAEGTIPKYYSFKDRTSPRASNFTISNTNLELLIKCKRILENFGILSEIKNYVGNQKPNRKTVYVLKLRGRSERINEQFSVWHINKDKTKKVPYFILKANLIAKQAYFDGYIAGDGHTDHNGRTRFSSVDKSLFTGICYILKSLNKNFSVDFKKAPNLNSNDAYSAAINKGKKYLLDRPNNVVRKIETYVINDVVYDLSTDNHTFTGGGGSLVNLHNTDSIFKFFTEEMERKGGILIIFMQLKENYDWYAPNMVTQFPALAARYIIDDTDTRKSGHWAIDVVREPLSNIYTVNCEFNRENNLLIKKDLI